MIETYEEIIAECNSIKNEEVPASITAQRLGDLLASIVRLLRADILSKNAGLSTQIADVKTDISALKVSNKTLTTSVSQFNASLIAERSQRVSEDGKLQTAIDLQKDRITQEAGIRSRADESLESSLTAVSGRLTSEINTRAAADGQLGEAIEQEAGARTAADRSLSDRIGAEAQTRANEDASLSERITKLSEYVQDL